MNRKLFAAGLIMMNLVTISINPANKVAVTLAGVGIFLSVLLFIFPEDL